MAGATEKAQTKDRETRRQRQLEKDAQTDGGRVGGEGAAMTGTEGQTDIAGKSNSKEESLPLRFSRIGGSPGSKNAF